jgi:hypothetical protein
MRAKWIACLALSRIKGIIPAFIIEPSGWVGNVLSILACPLVGFFMSLKGLHDLVEEPLVWFELLPGL